MILNLPSPYPDELLYSIFARYHVRSGNLSPKQTIEELFGNRTTRAVLDLPSHIKEFLGGLPITSLTADEVVNQYTLYPYYRPFLPQKRAKVILNSMLENDKGTIHTRIGISASNIKINPDLKYCPDCFKEDMSRYGETYWHRIHQAPGILLCPTHETNLITTNISKKMLNQHEFIIANKDTCQGFSVKEEFNEFTKQYLLEFSRRAKWLLDNPISPQKDGWYREQYKIELEKRGLTAVNGRIKKDQLIKSFLCFWGEEFLKILQSDVSVEKEANWLTMIVQKHRKSFHPIRHLLMMMFLEKPMESYFKPSTPYEPFGKGPWVCLSGAAEHYGRRVVNNLVITRDYDTGKPVGTFRCECGFVYSRRGPDQSYHDQFKIGRIKEFGDVWDTKLRELIQKEESLRGIAKTLNVDPSTVKRRATLLDIEFSWRGKSKSEVSKDPRFSHLSTKMDITVSPESFQKIWLELQHKNPGLSKTEIRKLRPDVYTWLYRHTREWLNEHSPNPKPIVIKKKRVDWEERDRDILKQVKAVIKSWDKDGEKPIRITVSSVGAKLNKLALFQSYPSKLPITMGYLKLVTEDIDTFQIRRAKRIIENISNEGKEVRIWEVHRLAGLRKTASLEVFAAIEKLANEVNEK